MPDDMGRSEIALAEPAALEAIALSWSSDCRSHDEPVDPSGRLPHVLRRFALPIALPGRFLVRFPFRIVRRRRAPHRRVRGFHVHIAWRGDNFDIPQSAFRRVEAEGAR